MKTLYANTNKPLLVKWITILSIILGITLFVLYILFDHIALFIAAYIFLFGAQFYGIYKMNAYEIDDEQGTITNSQIKKYPLYISNLATATYKESRKRRFRSLFLHDTGTGFMDIHTNKEKADQIVAHLLKLNPDIEVKHAHYL